MSIVVHSKDPYLLARISMELQMMDFEFNDIWNNVYHPFDKKYPPMNYMFIGDIDYPYGIEFHNHNCKTEKPIRLHLTENSYTEILSIIISEKKLAQ